MLFSATADGRTTLPLSLEPYGSVFVVFRRPVKGPGILSVERDGAILYSSEHPEKTNSLQGVSVRRDGVKAVLSARQPGKYHLTFAGGKSIDITASTTEPIQVPGPWTLSFPSGWGAPSLVEMNQLESWTNSTDAGVRYFSGRATYRTSVHLTKAQAAAVSSAILNLGEVHEVAAVRINGKVAGTLWKKPYAIRIDGMIHAGMNTIEVDVTNLWPNRLIGDAQDPNGKHYTWTNIRKYTKDSPLLPSGMLGPVRIESLHNLPSKLPSQSDASHQN